MKYLTLVFCLFTLTGCSSLPTYQAYKESLPATARAQLLGSNIREPESCNPNGPLILFSAVDGKSTDRYFGGYDNGCRFPSDVLLLPGEHTIQVFYAHGSSPILKFFCFTAEAGKTYQAEVALKGYQASFSAAEVPPTSAESGPRVTARACQGR